MKLVRFMLLWYARNLMKQLFTGHGLGLPHSDEVYFNRDRGDCMDYTDTPSNNMIPGSFNLELLEEVYGSPTIPLDEETTSEEGGLRYLRNGDSGDDEDSDDKDDDPSRLVKDDDCKEHVCYWDLGRGYRILIAKIPV